MSQIHWPEQIVDSAKVNVTTYYLLIYIYEDTEE